MLVSLAATLEDRIRDLEEPIADVLRRARDVQEIGESGDLQAVLDYLLDKPSAGAAAGADHCYRANLAEAISRYEVAMREMRTEFVARLVDTNGMSLTAVAKALGHHPPGRNSALRGRSESCVGGSWPSSPAVVPT